MPRVLKRIKFARRDIFKFDFWIVIVLSIAAFFFVGLGRTLHPSNIAWLANGDPAQHYLGWEFFRSSSWSLPPGTNPDYGLELSSSIVYSDSLPLLALLLKPFSGVLPQPFQYFGYWILLCFLLQGILSWQICRKLAFSPKVRILAVGLAILTPSFLWRLHGHFSLMGHWLILGALYLNFFHSSKQKTVKWVGLILIAALVHSYLLSMVFMLWLTDIVRRIWLREASWRWIFFEGITLLLLLSVILWAAGYFVISSGYSQSGYGFFRMNLLSPIDSDGWSYLLKDIPGKDGDYEGFNYFGLGNLFLLSLSIPLVLQGKAKPLWRRSRLPLIVLLGCLSIYAVSNQVGIGGYDLLNLKLPSSIVEFFEIFRVSGRFFWPVFYSFLFGMFWLICKSYRVSHAAFLLLIALAMQVVDIRAGFPQIQTRFSESGTTWENPLNSEFWSEAAEKYHKLRYIPIQNQSRHWKLLSYFAMKHGMPTDAVYLARVDEQDLRGAQQQAKLSVKNGTFEEDTIYILDQASAYSALIHTNSEDLLAKVDGLFVFARDGAQVASKISSKDMYHIKFSLKLPSSIPINFSQAGREISYLDRGWSNPESWGTWSNPESWGTWSNPESWGTWSDSSSARLLFHWSEPRNNLWLRMFSTLD